jgi:hypothetical protein
MCKNDLISNMAQYYCECIKYTGDVDDVLEDAIQQLGEDATIPEIATKMEQWAIDTQNNYPDMCEE